MERAATIKIIKLVLSVVLGLGIALAAIGPIQAVRFAKAVADCDMAVIVDQGRNLGVEAGPAWCGTETLMVEIDPATGDIIIQFVPVDYVNGAVVGIYMHHEDGLLFIISLMTEDGDVVIGLVGYDALGMLRVAQ